MKEKTEITDQIFSSKEARQVFNSGLHKLRQVAAYLSKGNLSNPRAYRLIRLTAWLAVDKLPPAIHRKTKILPPDEGLRNTLGDLEAKGEWKALLRSAEMMVSQFIFWLDLHRFVSEALLNLGNLYKEAYKVVCQETAFFIQRLPGLENLTFCDDTPLADSITKQWLKEIASGASSEEARSFSQADVSSTLQGGGFMGKEIKEAQSLVKKGKLIEAIERLQSQLRHSFAQREKLRWRLALSQLLLNSNEPKLALPYLEQILQEIDRYRLEEWDPELAIKSLKMVWIGFDSQSDKVSKDKAIEALNRMVKLDPAEALRLEKD